MVVSSQKAMVLWALLLGLLLVSPPAKAELERVEHAAKADGSLSFLVVGDWGRKGLYNQSQILHFLLLAEMAEIFFVDTTPFVSNYFIDPKDHVYDWKGISPRLHYINNLLLRITAKWKIVVGHHTIKSAGHHGNTHELAIHLLPILQAYHVDLYINGHDHCLQHISTTDRGDVNNRWNPQEMKFYYDGQGFMSVEITETDVDIKFYDVFGNAIYKWITSKLISSAM
ncbi:hypothetical protein ES288_D02G169100v1 [Gossypium darwinii]|nr:hypothetical protein ES288_D02G169100v1 [Gossypium darwinii]